MKYYCVNCDTVFDESEALVDPDDKWQHIICPNCKEDDCIENMRACAFCGEEILPTEQYCVDCEYELSATLGDAITKLRKRVNQDKSYNDVKQMFFEWCAWKDLM